MSKKKVIDVGLRIDIGDQIKELEKQFDSLSNRAGTKMSKDMAEQIASIKSELQDLNKQFNSLQKTTINTSTFQKNTKSIVEQVNNLSKRTDALEEGMSSLINSMSQHAGDELKKDLESISKQMDSTKQSAIGMINAVDSIHKALGQDANIKIETNIDRSSLEKEQHGLEEFYKKIQKGLTLDFEGEAFDGSIDKLIEDFEKLISRYNELENELAKDNLPINEYNKLSNEIVDVANKISELTYNIPDTPIFEKIFDYDFSVGKLNDFNDKIAEMLGSLASRVSSRLNEIRNELSNLTDGVSVDDKGRRLTVPLDISTNATTLVKRAKTIIDNAQPHLNKYPIKLQFVLQSGYSSRKTNSILSQMQKEIDELPAEIDKTGIQELYNDLSKDFNKELNIKIKANSLSDTERNVNSTLSKIRTAVEKPMEIHPQVTLTDKDIKSLQRQLNSISKSLVLNVDQINLLGKKKEGFDELSSLVSAIDMILVKLDEVKNQISPVWQTLVDIRNIINQISFSDHIAEVKTLMDTCANFLATIQKAYHVLDNNDLDNMFAIIQKRVQSITGSLRGNNLKEIKSILAEFEYYQKLGGSRSYTELGGADNVKNWFSRYATESTAIQKSWYEMGQDGGKWYAHGLEDTIPEVEEAAKKLVEAALAAIQKAQDSHSPAEEPRKLLHDFGEGAALGIEDTTKKVEKSASKLIDSALNEIEKSLDNADKATVKIDNFTKAIERLKSVSESWKVESIREVLEGISVEGDDQTSIRTNALKKMKEVINYFNKTSLDKGVWEDQYKYALKFMQLYEIYKANGGTKKTLEKYAPYYDKIAKNSDKMKLNLEALVSEFPTQKVSEGLEEIQNNSKKMGETLQEEVKASTEEVEKFANVLSSVKQEMLSLSKGVSGSIHKKAGIDEYYYKQKDRYSELTEEEKKLKDLIGVYNEAIVMLRQLGYTMFNGNLLQISGGSNLLDDASLSKLYGMGKRNNYIAQIANAVDKYRDTGNQEILKYIQDMIQKTKFGKYGADVRKKLLASVNSQLSKAAETAVESSSTEIRNETQEIESSLKGVSKASEESSNQLKEVANEHKEAAKAAKENANAHDELSTAFNKIKKATAKYAKPRANADNYQSDISKIVRSYLQYQAIGGTEPLSDLTKSKTVLSDLTAEYKKQTNVIKDNTSAQEQNSNTSSESISKKKSEQEKASQQTEKSNQAEQQAIEVSKKLTDQKKKEADAIRDVIEASEGVYKIGTYNPDTGSSSVTQYEDYFSEKVIKKSLDANGNVQTTETLIKRFVELEKQIQRNDNEIVRLTKDILNMTDTGADISSWTDRIKAITQYTDALLNLRKSWVYDPSLEPGQYHSDVFDIERTKNQEKQWAGLISAAQKKLQSFINTLSSMSKQDKYVSVFKNEIVDLLNKVYSLNKVKVDFLNEYEVNNFIDSLRQIAVEFLNIKAQSKLDTNLLVDPAEVASLANTIQNFLDTNSAAAKEYKVQLENIYKQLKDILDTGGELSKLDFSSLKAQANDIEATVRGLHQTGNSFWRSVAKNLKSSNAQFIATYFSFMDIVRYIRSMVTTVTEIDSALTELRKVSDASTERLVENFEKSAETAKDLGATISDVISATADWARMGYSVTAAEELARVTTLYKNVGDDISIDEASESLISTLQGFQLAYTDAEGIIDKFNEVSNNFAISSGDIGEALQRSAAAFSAANTDLSQSIALVAGTNEIVQDADSVGSMWTTVSARIRGATTELEDLGEESDEYVESTSKLRDLVKAIANVDIMVDDTTYKDIYTIVTEIGEVWDSISDINQAALLEALAGKRQANRLSATLTNIERVEEAYETAEESAGSAAKEQENYEKSIQYSLDRFIATLQELEADLIDSQLLKDIVDIGTGIVEVVDEIVEHIGLLGSLSIIGGFVGIIKNINELNKSFNVTKEVLLTIEKFNSGSIIKTDFIDTLSNSIKGLNKTQAESILVMAGVDAADRADILSKAGLAGANTTAALSYEALTAAMWANIKALGVWLVTNPVGWCILAAGAIAGVVAAVDFFTISVDEANDALDDFESKYDDIASDIEKHQKTVDNLTDSYYALAEGVDTVSGKNISLSSEDYNEFVATNQELAEMFPQLISGIDTYGNYILNLGNNADEAREKIAALMQQERDDYNYELYKDLPDVFENTSVVVEDTTKKLKESQETLQKYSDALKLNNSIVNLGSTQSASLDLSASYDNEVALSYLDSFRKKYAEMIQDIKESGNNVLAEDLQKSLSDVFDGDTQSRTISINLASLDYIEKEYLSDYFAQFSKELSTEYQMAVSSATADVAANQKSLQAEWNTLLKNIVGGINFLAEDEQIAEMVTNFANTLPAEFLEELEGQDIQHVIAQWISDAESLSKEDQLKFYDLFNAELTPQERIELYNTLAANLPKNFSIPIHYVIEDDQELIDRVNASINRLSSSNGVAGADYATKNELQGFFDEMGIDTEEEYNKWLEVTAGIDDATEAMEAYRNAVKEVVTDSKTIPSTLVESLNTIETQVSPLFDDLATLYDEIFNGDNGFTLKDIDYGDLQSLTEDITADLEDLGFEFSDAESKANDFLKVLSDSSSTSTDVQNAFNKIATAIINASDTYGTLNEETAEQMTKALESIGVTNALEIVTNKLAATEAYNTVQTDLASGASAEHANQLLSEANASDYARAAAFQLALTEANLSSDELDFSAKISSLEELANAYLDTALAAQIAAKADWANEQVSAGMMSEDAAFTVVQNYAKNLTAKLSNIHVDYSHTSDASSAGSSDADSYSDAYEEELEALEAQRDAGIISESEFLEKWKALILKYFGDIDKYGEEYAEEMAKYWDEAIEYLESVVSAIDTLLDKKIDAAEEGKDAAVSALEEEQEAAEKYYQDQIDYLDDLIENLEDEKDALQDQIDVIQDQIDALEDANDERERAINLQKAQYALQQAMNQRTLLQYVGGQMVKMVPSINDTISVKG